jgi:methionine-gamma-lyase
MMTLDGIFAKANALMELMQSKKPRILGGKFRFYKTLFSAPGTSTSSEIPLEEQADGLNRWFDSSR